MKKMDSANGQKYAMRGAAVLAMCVAVGPGAFASHRVVKPAEQPASVIAHVALPGEPATQIYLQERGEKQFLVIGQTSKTGFTVVDVSKPGQPNIVKRGSWPNESATGKFRMIGGGLAIVEAADSEMPAKESALNTETVRLIDWSDPENPRTIQTFYGVTSTAGDKARDLFYLINNDGLWILKHQPEQPAFSSPRGCATGDAFNELASCQ